MRNLNVRLNFLIGNYKSYRLDLLIDLRKETEKKYCSLRKRNKEAHQETYTPEVEGIPPEEEEQYQAIVFLQSIIEGRASQMLVNIIIFR